MISVRTSIDTYVVIDDENTPNYTIGVFEDGYFKFTCDFGLTSDNISKVSRLVNDIENELGLTVDRMN